MQLRLLSEPLHHIPGVPHVRTDRTSKSVAIDSREMDAGVGERFGRSLSAEWNVLELARVFTLDVRSRPEQQPVRYARHARESADPGLAALHRLPYSLPRVADRRDEANSGDNYTAVVRWTVRH